MFRTLKEILGNSAAEARGRLGQLEEEYRFVADDIPVIPVLKEVIRLAETMVDAMQQDDIERGVMPLTQSGKRGSATAKRASARWRKAVNAVFSPAPLPEAAFRRQGYAAVHLTAQQRQARKVKKRIDAQLKRKRRYLNQLLNYDSVVCGREERIRVFRLALFLDWSVVRGASETPERQNKVYLNQLTKLMTTFLNGMRHHKGLGGLQGYHWLTLRDTSMRPYIRLHLYAPSRHYHTAILQSIIERWLAMSPGNVCVQHSHPRLLEKLRFGDAMSQEGRPFGHEEKISLRAVLVEKRIQRQEEKAQLEREAELRLLAKRIMFYPRARSHHFSKEQWIKDKDIIVRPLSAAKDKNGAS